MARASRPPPPSSMVSVPREPPVPMLAKKVASRPLALSVETLEKLGAHRLAELLMGQADSDPAVARSLRLALAETNGTGTCLGAEVEKLRWSRWSGQLPGRIS